MEGTRRKKNEIHGARGPLEKFERNYPAASKEEELERVFRFLLLRTRCLFHSSLTGDRGKTRIEAISERR